MLSNRKFSIGTKVIILSLSDCSSTYPDAFVGEKAVIRKIYPLRGRTLIGVEIDGYSNSRSHSNCFWFPQENVEIYTEETTKIYVDKNINKESEGNIKMEKNVKVYVLAEVNDIDDTTLGVSYEELHEGDIVVCDYKYHNGKLSVRKVVRLYDENVSRLDCKILGVADCSVYFERKKRADRRAELKEKMIEQAKKYQEQEYWRLISETDPVMKAMYEEFKELDD